MACSTGSQQPGLTRDVRIGFTSFWLCFVTIVLNTSGKLIVAQAPARHSHISMASLSAHLADDELDKAYWHSFEES